MRGFFLFLIILLFFGGIVWFGFNTVKTSSTEAPRVTLKETLPDITEPTVTIVDPVRGSQNATVTIVEFGDYFCAFCQEMEPVLREVLAASPAKVRLVWKDAPNAGLHGQAVAAAEAARCAGEQNLFWPYHDLLLLRAGASSLISFADLAAELELDAEKFDACLESGRSAPLIARTLREAEALKISGVPFFFMNGKPFAGTTVSEFSYAIDTILAQ